MNKYALSRRLFSSGSTVRLTETSVYDASAPIPAKVLPRVLRRQIEHYTKPRSEQSGEIDIPNPFILQRGQKLSDSEITGEPRYRWYKPTISARRQKKLLQLYPSTDLPSSALNPQAISRTVRWNDDSIIKWTGEVPEPKQIADETRSVYAGRKRMFKGHRDERDRPKKEADRKARMDGMEKRISEWRQTRADEKSRNRPSLPF